MSAGAVDSEIERNQIRIGRMRSEKDCFRSSWWILYLVKGVRFSDGKAPPSLEGPPDHGRAGGGSGRGEAERVLKPEPNNLHAQVHEVHCGVEVRQLWLRQFRRDFNADAMEGLCVCVCVCVCVCGRRRRWSDLQSRIKCNHGANV